MHRDKTRESIRSRTSTRAVTFLKQNEVVSDNEDDLTPRRIPGQLMPAFSHPSAFCPISVSLVYFTICGSFSFVTCSIIALLAQNKLAVQQGGPEMSQSGMPLQQTLKEKAYTVRDVLITKNAFNRRGSKMIRAKTATASALGRRVSTKPVSNYHFTSLPSFTK